MKFHLLDLTDEELNARIDSLTKRIEERTQPSLWKCRLEASLWSAKRVRKCRKLGIRPAELPLEDDGE